MRRDQINVRVPHILKKILIDKENMSEFVIEAIEDKLKAERNPEYREARIKELKAEIKELRGVKEVNTDYVIGGLYEQYHNRVFTGVTDAMLLNWIEARVTPSLSKIGYRGTLEEILKLFKEYKS